MDIRFIRKTIGKQSINDMVNIMKDLILKSDISSINNFSELKQYHAGDKVYVKDGKIHRVYVCKVANSTVGKILDNEWRQYIESDIEDKRVNPIDIYEETGTVDFPGYEQKLGINDFNLSHDKVAVFNSVQPRLRYGIDFTVTETGVVKFLKSLGLGEKLIFEIRRLNGKIFNNLFREVYVEETYIPLRKTKIVPIKYHGYRASSKLQVFNKDGNLLTLGIDYTLRGNIIILSKWINPGDKVHLTMWNEVMIKPTSKDYIIDDEGNVYKLGVNDDAQLLLTEINGTAIGNPYIELISDDGKLYHCKPTTDKKLSLSRVEPDIILATDNKHYKLSVDSYGSIYLKEVESDYHKDMYLVSTDSELYQLLSTNGELNIKAVTNTEILINTLAYKDVVSDDGVLYRLTIVDGTLIAVPADVNYNKEKPIKYLNLISASGINFVFFATNDEHLAVRPIYVVDDSSNIILGDDGGLYLIGMTNEGEIFNQEVRTAPFVAEHKQITDSKSNLYEIHIDENKDIYIQDMVKTLDKQIPVTLDSDAKDEYIVFIIDDYLTTYNTKHSTIVKDVTTGYEYMLYVDGDKISTLRVQTELLEKRYLPLSENGKIYKLVVDNGNVKLIDVNVTIPEKEDTVAYLSNEDNSSKYKISVVNGELTITKEV